MKLISIIVCTYNREKYLAGVLKSLKNQTSASFEIIVINNNSSDNTLTVCENFKTKNPKIIFKYFTETKQGLSHAKNRGIDESSGNFVVFVDDDAYVNKEYVENILQFTNSNPAAKVIGGKIIPVYENKPSWVSSYLEPIFGKLDMGEEIKFFEGNKFPFGGNSGAKKEIFDRFGKFNPKLGRQGNKMLASEEKDFYNRIKTGGIKMYYLPKMILFHHAPTERTTPEFVKKQAIGIGRSERIRAKNEGSVILVKSFSKEFFKWVATLAISTLYFIKADTKKAKMLIKFRLWVSKGIFGKS